MIKASSFSASSSPSSSSSSFLRALCGSVSVQDETGESAVFVVVAAMGFASVQLDVDLVPGVQVQDDAVGGVVVVLVSVLSDGTGSHLREGWIKRKRRKEKHRQTGLKNLSKPLFTLIMLPFILLLLSWLRHALAGRTVKALCTVQMYGLPCCYFCEILRRNQGAGSIFLAL